MAIVTVRKRSWRTSKGESRSGFAVDYFDAQGVRHRKQFATKAEANDFRIEIEGQMRTGTYRPEATKILVSELAEQFIAHCRARMERRERMTRRNFQTYEGYVRNYICPDPLWHTVKHAKPGHQRRLFEKGLADFKLSRLTVGTVTKFRDDLRAFGVSVPTTRKIIGMLQVMLAYGVSQDLLAFNAAKDVEVLSTRADDSKRIIPPDRELVRQLVELADERFRVILLLRPQPACGPGSCTPCAGSTLISSAARCAWKPASMLPQRGRAQDPREPPRHTARRGGAACPARLESNDRLSQGRRSSVPEFQGRTLEP